MIGFAAKPGTAVEPMCSIRSADEPAPKPIEEGVDKAEAEKLKGDLEEAGGSVELK